MRGEKEERLVGAPMSSTSTSTSTSSKLAGKLTLSGGSMHPSQSTAGSNPTDVAEQQNQASEPRIGVYEFPDWDVILRCTRRRPRRVQQSAHTLPVQFHQRSLNLILVPATLDSADIISIESCRTLSRPPSPSTTLPFSRHGPQIRALLLLCFQECYLSNCTDY